MHLRILANKVYKHKGFVYENEQWSTDESQVEMLVRPRKGSRPVCSRCGSSGSTYDRLKPRRFQMIPVWGIAVVLLYAMRRVDCKACQAVCVERVPWSVSAKSHLTTAFAHHLAGWARFLSWKEVSKRCGTTWESVAQSVEWLVKWGLEHRSLDGIKAIGVDEIQTDKGHHYSTLVYQIDQGCKRLLWIGKERTKSTFEGFFDMLGKDRAQSIQVVCSDMWKAYLTVIAERIPQALNVLDRFHIVGKLNEAVDATRRDEVRRLAEQGKEPALKKTRWIWLKRWENLKESQYTKLSELLQVNLRTVKAYLIKESFDQLWTYTRPAWAKKFLDNWCKEAMRHRSLPRIKTFVGTVRKHRELILNYFEAKTSLKQTFSSGVIEGFNNKAKLSIRKSYGFRSQKYREMALFHALGALPEPKATHRFS